MKFKKILAVASWRPSLGPLSLLQREVTYSYITPMGPGRGGVCGAGAAWRKLIVLLIAATGCQALLLGGLPTRHAASPLSSSSRSDKSSRRQDKRGAWRTAKESAVVLQMANKDRPLAALRKRSKVLIPKILRKSPQRPLKVALLVEPTPFTHVCGYANRFKEMLRFLRESGDTEVSIATPDDKDDAPKEYEGFPVSTVTGYRLPLYPEVCLTGDLKGEAKKMIDDFKPDLIHVSSPGFLVLAAVVYAKANKIPLVMSYHTHLPVYAEKYTGWIPFSRNGAWRYIKLLHSFADLTLVTSPQILAEFKDHGIRRVSVWRKGVDTEVFNPKHRDLHTRAEMSKDPSNPVMLYVGRLSVEKRLEDVSHVLDSCPTTSLALVGGGPHEDKLREHFARFGDRVRFLGVKRGLDLSKCYASADIFCMPSDSETLGFVVIEAMASGCAVVGANAGGIPSIINDKKNGLLAQPRNPQVFADAVKSLVDDPEKRRQLALKARSDAEGWGWEAATKHLRQTQYTAAIRRHNGLMRLRRTERKFRIFPPVVRKILRKRVKTALTLFSTRVKNIAKSLSPWTFLSTFVQKYRIVTSY